MNYAILTDNSSAAVSMMNSVGASQVHAFSAHILWVMLNATDANILTVQNSPNTYASLLLPKPL